MRTPLHISGRDAMEVHTTGEGQQESHARISHVQYQRCRTILQKCHGGRSVIRFAELIILNSGCQYGGI